MLTFGHSHSVSAPKPRKTPRQARARATVEAILEAAARILTGETVQALTTNRVAETAGVSIGSLYQYFPNKEAILAELIREKRSRLTAALAQAEGPDRLVATIRAAVEVQLPWARLARALTEAEAFLPLAAETEAFERDLFGRVAQAIGPASETEARDVIALSAALIEAAGLRGETDADVVAARVERAVRGYLGRPLTA